MSDPVTGFVAGFASRHDAAAQVLRQAFAPPSGFAEADPRTRAATPATTGPVSFAPAPGPKHFSPADRDANPTAGWDPLDAHAQPSGFIDPVEAAHAAGYAEGLAAAAAAAESVRHRDEGLVTGIAAALGVERIDRDAIAAQLRQTVMFLVTKLVGDVGIAGERLGARIEAAADLLSDAAESALLRVHPDDVALLEGRLPKTIFAAGDASLSRGSFVLESASTVVEDGPALWLEQLAAAIDRVPMPAIAPAMVPAC